MKIEFEITQIPTDEQKAYIVAYLEGILKIFLDGSIFFNQPGVLLIEYALFIKDWLDRTLSGEAPDLIYETMDYDQPIITIKLINNGLYKIDSIWKEKEIDNLISPEELINCFQKYITDIDKALEKKMGIQLHNIIYPYK